MKKINILITSICAILATAVSVAAQEKVKVRDFTGTWELDTKKTTFLEHEPRMASSTITIRQSDKEIAIKRENTYEEDDQFTGEILEIESDSKNKGDGFEIYKFDGTEKIRKMKGTGTSVEAKTSLKLEKHGGFVLTTHSKVNHQMGQSETTSTEKWELSDDGKILTILREIIIMGGAQKSKMIFVRKVNPSLSLWLQKRGG